MSKKAPTKTDFSDDWREDASCRAAVQEEPTLRTAWDNVDTGTWEEDASMSDPLALVAKNICFACPVRAECLRDALEDNEAEGMRGGFRFERGYITREDSYKLYKEFNLRSKVRKVSRIVYLPDSQV